MQSRRFNLDAQVYWNSAIIHMRAAGCLGGVPSRLISSLPSCKYSLEATKAMPRHFHLAINPKISHSRDRLLPFHSPPSLPFLTFLLFTGVHLSPPHPRCQKGTSPGTRRRDRDRMPENQGTTVDEFSMETSKGFLNALQELKNLRPQLYSAAEYCEKSYLQNEQKQMVMDNLKEYTVQALVNAVDHLGTVAYKLNDLFQQQAFDISTTELKISYLNQQLLTCQMYADKEGLRQQQLFMTVPHHHKHYILPNSRNRKVQTDAQKQIDMREKHSRAKPRPHPSGTPASKTLSWHLASEAESERNFTLNSSPGAEDPNSSGIDSKAFHLLARCRSPGGSPFSGPNLKTACTTRDPLVASKQFLDWRETSGQPIRSKSVLSAFFVKNKYAKQNS